MKIKILFLSLIGLFLFYINSYSQTTTKEIGIKDLDSLIKANIDPKDLAEFSPNQKTNTIDSYSRAANTCDYDYQNILSLFKNLKTNYVACCNGKSNYRAVAQIIASIYSIINNSECKWGVRQWLVFSYYLGDYADFVSEMGKCCK